MARKRCARVWVANTSAASPSTMRTRTPPPVHDLQNAAQRRLGDGGGHAVTPTGGGSQSMIGVVNDTGSDGIRDAVISALQRAVR